MKKIILCLAAYMCIFMMSDFAIALAPVEKESSAVNKTVDEQSINTPTQKKKQLKTKGTADDPEKEKKEQKSEDQK